MAFVGRALGHPKGGLQPVPGGQPWCGLLDEGDLAGDRSIAEFGWSGKDVPVQGINVLAHLRRLDERSDEGGIEAMHAEVEEAAVSEEAEIGVAQCGKEREDRGGIFTGLQPQTGIPFKKQGRLVAGEEPRAGAEDDGVKAVGVDLQQIDVAGGKEGIQGNGPLTGRRAAGAGSATAAAENGGISVAHDAVEDLDRKAGGVLFAVAPPLGVGFDAGKCAAAGEVVLDESDRVPDVRADVDDMGARRGECGGTRDQRGPPERVAVDDKGEVVPGIEGQGPAPEGDVPRAAAAWEEAQGSASGEGAQSAGLAGSA